VRLVTWTWPSIRILPLRRDGLEPPCSSSEAAGEEIRELPAAASAPAPRLRSASRRVIFESPIRFPFPVDSVRGDAPGRGWRPGIERVGQDLARGADVALRGADGWRHPVRMDRLHDGCVLVPDLLSVSPSLLEQHRHHPPDLAPLAAHHLDHHAV